MTTLIVGDVHGCAEELDRLLQAVRPRRVVLVGDLYTKGPDPVGVWSLLDAHAAESVMGNHDQRLLDVIAGTRPTDRSGAETVSRLDAADEGWRAHLRALPLFLEGVGPYTVVHAALDPTGSLSSTTRAMALSMRSLPGRPGRWHEHYRGDRAVVFGHDAAGGLVWRTRGGQPWIVGLDTGCVYGGTLSGLVVEEARLVQVPARRVYKSVGVVQEVA